LLLPATPSEQAAALLSARENNQFMDSFAALHADVARESGSPKCNAARAPLVAANVNDCLAAKKRQQTKQEYHRKFKSYHSALLVYVQTSG
jgi:hypothetical protein